MTQHNPASSTVSLDSDLLDEEPKSQCQYSVDDMRTFNRTYMAFLISVGLLGNFLIIIVFMSSKLRRVPSNHYLTALAAADAGVLTCRCLASLQTAYPYLLIGPCQWLIYANNVCACLSVWYVVGFTIERFVAVWYPLARLRWCTIRRTRGFIFGATMVAAVFYLYLFIFIRVQRRGSHRSQSLEWTPAMNSSVSDPENLDLDPDPDPDPNSVPNSDPDPNWENDTICDILPKYVQLALSLNYADSVLTLILPLVLVVGFNASIAFKFLWPRGPRSRKSREEETIFSLCCTSRRSEKKKGLPEAEHSDDHVLDNGLGQDSALLRASVSTACGSVVTVDLRRHGGKSRRQDERVTRLLFIISSAFLIMNMPDHIVRMVIFALVESGKWKDMSLNARCQFELCQQLTNTIFHSYFAVNFVLYNVVGVNFRRELRLLLKRTLSFLCRTSSRREFVDAASFSLSRPGSASNSIVHSRRSTGSKKTPYYGRSRGISGYAEANGRSFVRRHHDASPPAIQL